MPCSVKVLGIRADKRKSAVGRGGLSERRTPNAAVGRCVGICGRVVAVVSGVMSTDRSSRGGGSGNASKRSIRVAKLLARGTVYALQESLWVGLQSTSVAAMLVGGDTFDCHEWHPAIMTCWARPETGSSKAPIG